MRIPNVFSIAALLFFSLWCGVPFARGAEDGHVEAEVTDDDAMGESDPAHGHHDAGGSGEVPFPIPLDPDLAIVTAIIFLLLLAVLWKFAWGPISEALDQRERSVAENIAAAHRSNEDAKRLLAEHESKLAGAAGEVRQMLDEARKDAESQKQQILTDAQAAAEAEKERALRAIDAAKNAALQDLAQKSVDTAVDLAGKIVHRQLTDADHGQLVTDALQQFPSNN